MKKIFGPLLFCFLFNLALAQMPAREFPKNPTPKDSVSLDSLSLINDWTDSLLEADSSSVFF